MTIDKDKKLDYHRAPGYYKSVSFKEKELPVLKKDDQKEITLTSIGIFLVGLSGYILVSSYEKKGEK